MVRYGWGSHKPRLSVPNFVSHSLETGKLRFEAMEGKNEAQKVLLVHEDVVSGQKNPPYHKSCVLLASFPGPVPIFQMGPGNEASVLLHSKPGNVAGFTSP